MTRPWRGFGVASDSASAISTWYQFTCEFSFLRAVRGSSKTNSDSGTWVNICCGSRVRVHGKIQSCSSHKSFYLFFKAIYFSHYEHLIEQITTAGIAFICSWLRSKRGNMFSIWILLMLLWVFINCPLQTWNVVHVHASAVQVAVWEPRSRPQLGTRCPCSC